MHCQGFGTRLASTIRALYLARSGDSDSTISDPTWITRFKIHARIVDRYRAGRVFLAGDAAHIHSPAGGQGITTGMQDATNLAWKLVHVLRHGAPESLLDSYEEERRPVAQSVLDATDRNTKLLFARGGFGKWFRDHIFLPLLATETVQGRLVRRMSQLDQGYRANSLARATPRSWGRGLVAGDRAPDILLSDGSALFSQLGKAPLALLARAEPALSRGLERLGISSVVCGASARDVYGSGDELWLVRPDGYIAYRGRLARPDQLVETLSRFYAPPAVRAAFADPPAPMGQIAMWCGAGFHLPWLIPLGLFVVLLAWANGLWSVKRADQRGQAAHASP